MTSRVLVALRISAPPDRVFAAFTRDIGRWWRPNGLFQFTSGRDGRMGFELGPEGRLIETYDDGEQFEVGRVQVWEPPARLVFTWRQASFSADQTTEVHVRFEAIDDQTRVTVEHFGWDSIPQGHAARHGLPLFTFQQRHAEWWQAQLDRLGQAIP